MNTLNTKGAYTRIRTFMKDGDKTCIDNLQYDSIFKAYYYEIIKSKMTPSTYEQKRYYILLFLRYLNSNHIIIENVQIMDILNYSDICNNHAWNINLQSRNRAYLRHFLNWLHSHNYIEFSGYHVFPFITWKKKISIRSQYTDKEVSQYLDSFTIETKKEKEEFLIMSMIIYLGLRISDVVFLKLSDINFIDQTITITQYKTKNILVLPLLEEIQLPLADYLIYVRPSDCEIDYLFVTQERPYRHKKELRGHYHISSSHFELAGIDTEGRKRGFHAFRHSFSTRMLNDNGSIYSITKMLGHSSVEVTKAYLDTDTSKLKLLALEVPHVESL